jgi:4-methyl-5(b-hydroxyethyl)-thiazole monophosphate biosynthesis
MEEFMRVIVPLAEGFEEIEAVTIIDVLRRAGIEVTTVYLKKNPITGSHAITILADKNIDEISAAEFDCIALPGGMPGSENLKEDSRVIALIRELNSKNKIIAAVCAAPIVLSHAGILAGKRATCFPGYESYLTGVTISPGPVVRDGKVITGKGPGCALPFALELVEAFSGKEAVAKLRDTMQIYGM